MAEDKSLTEFLQAFDERKRKENSRAQMQIQVIERKRKTLAPLRDFLQKFVDLGLIVAHSGVGEPGISAYAQKSFTFYETESSPSWAPGVSLYFDHPAEVEIAISNDSQQEKDGLVVIRSVTNHRDRLMLHQTFRTVDQAKDALAKFLGKNAISIENDPRARKAALTKPTMAVMKSAPHEPPEDPSSAG